MTSDGEVSDFSADGTHSDNETGDLTLSISVSESEHGSSSDENIIQPFMYEPEETNRGGLVDSSSSDEDGDQQSPRLNNTSWCTCGKCVPMPTAKECLCCMELDQMKRKLESDSSETIPCITLHPGFQAVCLNTDVLQTAYFAYRQHYSEDIAGYRTSLNDQRRHTAYRQLTRWCWEWLGRRIRITLPSCAVMKIRNTFPSESGVYVGYKDVQMSD